MKIILPIVIFIFLNSCQSGLGTRQPRIITIQPIGHVDAAELTLIKRTIREFYDCPVTVLPEVSMPSKFLNQRKGERYSADAILKWLRAKNDIILGVTSKDIYTNNKERKDTVWGILGLGYCPGNTCIISDYRITQVNLSHRLSVLALHELGHNLGLPHCNTQKCIMNDAEGRVATLDSARLAYCEVCRHRLKEAPWPLK